MTDPNNEYEELRKKYPEEYPYQIGTSLKQKAKGRSYEHSLPYKYFEYAYDEYALQYGRSQSLGKLCERGGLGVTEAMMLMAEHIERLRKILTDRGIKLP